VSKLYQMGDKSTPPQIPCDLPVFAFYLGGTVDNIWPIAEIAKLAARWGLPIWGAIDTRADPAAEGGRYAETVAGMGWKKGTTIAVDTEAVVMGAWLATFDDAVHDAGYNLMHYQSSDAAAGNPPTSGGLWAARWDGKPFLAPGSVATQYATAKMNNSPWDLSVINAGVPLHELNPIAATGTQYQAVDVDLPVLTLGQSGWPVRMLQALLLAALPDTPPMGLEDGKFGPITAATLRDWQLLYGVEEPAGTCGPRTWESLVYRQ
jgi:hypothetical protein